MSKNTSLAVSGNKPFGGPKSKSGFPGVSFHKCGRKWVAFVQLASRKRKQIPGLYPTAKAAADARAAFIARHGTAMPIPRAKAASVTGEVAIA